MLKDAESLFFVTRDSRFFVTHRLELAQAALKEGFSISVVCDRKDSASWEHLKDFGLKLHQVSFLSTSGKVSFPSELGTFLKLFLFLFRYRPALCHSITVKSGLYCGLICRILQIPHVALISGQGNLGELVAKTSLLSIGLKRALRIAFKGKDSRVVFQNSSDLKLFLSASLVHPHHVRIIRGSGVNTKIFRKVRLPSPAADRVVVAMGSRLLKEKGVEIFCQAATIARMMTSVDLDFRLFGEPDLSNPGSLTSQEVTRLCEEHKVCWLGHVKDMADELNKVEIFCLPSRYPEGLPKAILEAMSCECAVIAGDIPGCSEAIDHMKTGVLVNPTDPRELARWICILAENQLQREALGKNARSAVESLFSSDIINQEFVRLYRDVLVK